MTSKIFSGAEIARAAKNKRTIQLTKSQTAKAAKKAITTKYGKINPAAYYYHSSNGAWVKYSKEKDDKVISNNKARDKKTLDNYPQKYDGFKTKSKKPASTKKQSRLSGPKPKSQPKPRKSAKPVNKNAELESIYGMDVEAMESEIIKMDKSSKRTNPKSMKVKGKSINKKLKSRVLTLDQAINKAKSMKIGKPVEFILKGFGPVWMITWGKKDYRISAFSKDGTNYSEHHNPINVLIAKLKEMDKSVTANKDSKSKQFEYVKAKYDELINNPNYQNPYSRHKFILGLKSDVRDYNYKLSKSFYRENQEEKNNIIANMRAAEAVIKVAKLNKSKKPTGAAVLEMNFERTPFLNGEEVIKAYSKNLLNKGLSREKTLTATADKFKLDSSDVKILQKELKKMKSIPEMVKKANPKKLGYSSVKIDTKRKKVYFIYPVGTGNRLKSKNNPKHHILTFSKLNNFSDTGELEQYLRAKIQNVRNSNAINKSNYKSKRGVFEMNKNSSKVITKREKINPTTQIKLF